MVHVKARRCGARGIRGLLAAVGAFSGLATASAGATAVHTLRGAVPGATYIGDIDHFSGLAITFEVSSNAKEVTDTQVPQPLQLRCLQGKAGPNMTAISSPATISKESFTVHAHYSGLPTGSAPISIVVTGHFGTHGAESGTVTFTYRFTKAQAANLKKNFDCKTFVASGTYTAKAGAAAT